MLTVEEARKAGINACIDAIGREFVLNNKETATCAYITNEYGSVFCFVGVGDREKRENDGAITLDNTSKFQYQASCSISLIDGMVTFDESLCVVPRRAD